MNAAEKDIDPEIVRSLLEDLRDLPDGMRITVKELIAESFYADDVFDDVAWGSLWKLLCSACEREKIILTELADGSFIVHNEDAKYVCPHCGSKDTVHIMYGLPEFTPRLTKRLDEGRLRLGGCVLSFATGDRYCCRCQREFYTTPSQNRIRENDTEETASGSASGSDMPEDIEKAESLTYSFSIVNRMTVEYRINGAAAVCQRGPYLHPENGNTEERQISESVWFDLIRQLYEEFKFHEWDPEYINDRISDGIEWEITVQFPNGSIQQRRGRNAHPSCWADFTDLILTLFR